MYIYITILIYSDLPNHGHRHCSRLDDPTTVKLAIKMFTVSVILLQSHHASYDLALKYHQHVGSMYAISTYMYLIFMANVGKYTINESYG